MLGVHVPYRRSKLTLLLRDCFEDTGGSGGGGGSGGSHHLQSRTVFLAHVSPVATAADYTRNTLEYTKQLLEVQQAAASGSGGRPRGPERWTRGEFRCWLVSVDGGRYAAAEGHFAVDGRYGGRPLSAAFPTPSRAACGPLTCCLPRLAMPAPAGTAAVAATPPPPPSVR